MKSIYGIPALLMLVMMAWGLNIPAVKALTGLMPVQWVGAVRLFIACIVITVFLFLRDRALPRLTLRQWSVLAGIAIFTIYGNQLLFVHGMRLASASNASLTMALMPLLAVVAGAIFFREPISLRISLGLAMGFSGVALAIVMTPRAQMSVPGLGELSLLAGLAAFVSGGLLIQKAAHELDVVVIGWATYLCGTAMLLLHCLVGGGWGAAFNALQLDWVWWCALYSGVLGTALSNIGWYYAVGKVGQGRASPYLYWIAVFGVAFSALTLSEPIGWSHAIGLAMVVLGVRLGAGRKPTKASAVIS